MNKNDYKIWAFIFPTLAALCMLLSGVKVLPLNGWTFLIEALLLICGLVSFLLKGEK